jgi:hypothetical protein
VEEDNYKSVYEGNRLLKWTVFAHTKDKEVVSNYVFTLLPPDGKGGTFFNIVKKIESEIYIDLGYSRVPHK